mgnify:CR=1 FL=1
MDLCFLYVHRLLIFQLQPMFYFTRVNPMLLSFVFLSTQQVIWQRWLSSKLFYLPPLSISHKDPSSFLGYQHQLSKLVLTLQGWDHCRLRHLHYRTFLLLGKPYHLPFLQHQRIYLFLLQRYPFQQQRIYHLHHYYRNLSRQHFHYYLDLTSDQSLQNLP